MLPTTAVPFIFARVRKQPRSDEERERNASYRWQAAQISGWKNLQRVDLAPGHLEFTTYRKKAFVDSQAFRDAVADARANGIAVVIGDVEHLLQSNAVDRIERCIRVLEDLPVPVIDAHKGLAWKDIPNRELMTLKVAGVMDARRKAVRTGLQIHGAKQKGSTRTNAKLGTLKTSRNADQRAARLMEFVRDERQRLAPGTTLSPAKLARDLNEADISAARGGKWSFNSAKNLLARIDEMDQVDERESGG